MSEQNKHWLLREENIRKLWMIFIAILVLTVIAGVFVHQHVHFGIENSFAFFAWYGFATCVGMVLFAKFLGFFLKRPEDFYNTQTDNNSNKNVNEDKAQHD